MKSRESMDDDCLNLPDGIKPSIHTSREGLMHDYLTY